MKSSKQQSLTRAGSFLAMACLTTWLAACGGGGGGTSETCAAGDRCPCDTTANCPTGEVCELDLEVVALVCVPDPNLVDAGDAGDTDPGTDADTSPDVPDTETDVPTDTDAGGPDTEDVTDVEDAQPDADITDGGTDGSGDTDVEDTDVDPDTDVTPDADTTDGGNEGDTGFIRPSLSPPLTNPWVAVETDLFTDLSALPPVASQVALIRPSSSEVIRIASGDSEMLFPTFSPDGRRIAFVSRNVFTLQLEVVDLETGEFSVLLETPPAGIQQIEWDYTGRYIAFDAIADRTVTPQTRDIYVYDFTTDEATRLTTDTADDFGPRWTLDGRIWFTSTRDGSGSGAIFTVTPAGAEERVSDDLNLRGRLAVDPTGAFVIAQAFGGGSVSLIRYVVDDDADSEVTSTYDVNGPDIASDALLMAFTTNQFGNSDVAFSRSFFRPPFAADDRLTETSTFRFVNVNVSPVESDAFPLAEVFSDGGT
jgi:hypothetical protein